MIKPPKHTQRRNRKGASVIEFALAFTVLVPILLGTFHFGMGFFYYNELLNSVRAAARYGGMRSYDSPTQTPSDAYLTAVKNVAVYGDPNGGTTPVVPGLTQDNIQVNVDFTNGTPARVRVAVHNFSMNVILSRMVTSKPSAVFPYLGVYMPST